MIVWTSAAAAFVVAYASLWIGLRSPLLRLLADVPNERSLHSRITPRFGGLGILTGVLICSALPANDDGPAFLAAFVALAVLSAIDDRRPLPAPLRLLGHLIVATLWLRTQDLSWLIYPALLLAMVWAINLNNFMDGADGLCAGMATCAMTGYAAVALLGGQPILATLCAIVAAATLAFLCFNFPPARVFMGDAGSIPLGFAGAAIGILGYRHGLWSPLFPLILYFPFVFDASLTLLRRAVRGERVWRPHREHLYQKSILNGLTHRQMTLRAYGLMLLCGLLALVSSNFPPGIQTLIIAGQTVVGMAIAYRIETAPKRRTNPS